MNEKTKDALIDFIDAMENLTAAVVLTIGEAQAGIIIGSCEKLKTALQKDETIL